MRGLFVHRSRTIPVQTPPTPTSSVLVVESEGDYMGFVVPALKAIESTHWQPQLGRLAKPRNTGAAGDAICTQLALMGKGTTERMIPVLDLKKLARSIQARAAQAFNNPSA